MKLPRQEVKKGRIEIIPMIDAIFFLLVYFIMTSLSLTQMESHGVQLPESRSVAGTKPQDKLVVTVTRDGSLFLDRDPVGEGEIRARVAERVNADPEIAVVLNGDKNGDVGKFLRVFDLVKQADARNVLIATTPPASGAGGAPGADGMPVDRR